MSGRAPLPEELTDEQRSALREELERVRDELESALERSGEAARPVELDQPIGRVSRIDAIQQQKMVEAGRRGQEARLRLIRAGLARMDAGEYGLCAECEEPIAYRRLLARPESRLCLACQSGRERG